MGDALTAVGSIGGLMLSTASLWVASRARNLSKNTELVTQNVQLVQPVVKQVNRAREDAQRLIFGVEGRSSADHMRSVGEVFDNHAAEASSQLAASIGTATGLELHHLVKALRNLDEALTIARERTGRLFQDRERLEENMRATAIETTRALWRVHVEIALDLCSKAVKSTR